MLLKVLQYLTGISIIGIFVAVVIGLIYFYPVAVNYITVSCLEKYSVEQCREALK